MCVAVLMTVVEAQASYSLLADAMPSGISQPPSEWHLSASFFNGRTCMWCCCAGSPTVTPIYTTGVRFRTLLILLLCIASVAAPTRSPVQQGRLPSHECCCLSAKLCCQHMPCMVGCRPVLALMLTCSLLQLWHVTVTHFLSRQDTLARGVFVTGSRTVMATLRTGVSCHSRPTRPTRAAPQALTTSPQ
jgi:hypothetical protein